MVKIAIIEDDRGLSNGITLALKQEGYAFFPFSSLAEVTDISGFDLIILDINLPDGNGFDFLRKIRQLSNVPVIILTANDQEMDEVMGLELGADALWFCGFVWRRYCIETNQKQILSGVRVIFFLILSICNISEKAMKLNLVKRNRNF